MRRWTSDGIYRPPSIVCRQCPNNTANNPVKMPPNDAFKPSSYNPDINVFLGKVNSSTTEELRLKDHSILAGFGKEAALPLHLYFLAIKMVPTIGVKLTVTLGDLAVFGYMMICRTTDTLASSAEYHQQLEELLRKQVKLDNDYPDATGSSPFKHLKEVLGVSKSPNKQVEDPSAANQHKNSSGSANDPADGSVEDCGN
ncbi:hypothetical protein PCANC_15426 [Puccinia coronata f. sp. avenae]|uniref:Uncharacterized protein n=1 Tax=Puccinia coronata f. sp. avenae TaxID=200324 RepID=A0A2N5SWJ7_9BASI|nr:hypothetical protein PCANC_15426 [Puccinia coronata f. sp. avenae]